MRLRKASALHGKPHFPRDIERVASQENVEVVRRGWDAWQRGDMDALVSIYAPDVVWDLSDFRNWPESV